MQRVASTGLVDAKAFTGLTSMWPEKVILQYLFFVVVHNKSYGLLLIYSSGNKLLNICINVYVEVVLREC